jgi:hypothetical protein
MADILYAVNFHTFLPALLAVLIVLFYEYSKATQRQRMQNDIVKTKENILSKGHWFYVRYSSETRFFNLFKLVSWDAAGILFISHTKIIFFWKGPQKIHEITFDPKAAVTWIGRNLWRNGWFSWIVIECGTKYYFTAETGLFPFGSKDATKKIYDAFIKIGLKESTKRRIS